MTTRHPGRIPRRFWATLAAMLLAAVAVPAPALAQATADHEVTFSKDIAPILQRSCQNCHRPDALAPMSLITYDDVRPWARAIKNRTGLRDTPGVMPPWFIEKDIGIQRFKDDPSLSDEEIRLIAAWADNGAPQGNPADLPPPIDFRAADEWEIGEPDLVVSSPSFEVKGTAPDWWGPIGSTPSGLTEDRYVAALEYKEVTESVEGERRATVGGNFVVHHAAMTPIVPGMFGGQGRRAAAAGGGAATGAQGRRAAAAAAAGRAGTGGQAGARSADGERPRYEFDLWPVHEVGRNADTFHPRAGRLLQANTDLMFAQMHVHANGADTRARLDVAFKFHPRGYEPTLKNRFMPFGTISDLDFEAMDSNQVMEAFYTLQENTRISIFEPHMHAPGVRMCLDAIQGAKIETLNCAGYDHSWVRVYTYEDDAAPLLPKGTILRITGYFNNSPSNPNVPDPRNWSGGGQRSVDQMFLNLMRGIELTDEEFAAEMAERRQALGLAPGEAVIGCPLCGAAYEPAEDAGDQQ